MKGDLVGGVAFMLAGLAVMAGAVAQKVGTPTEPQPGFFPFLGGAVIVALSLALQVQALRGHSSGGQAFGEMRRPAILVIGMAVYAAVLDPLGYVISTVFIGALILRVLGVTSWRVLAVTSVLLAVGTYAVFDRLLGVELPAGVLDMLD